MISDWLDRRGILADRRSGRPRQVLATLERLENALERQLGEWRRRGGPSAAQDDGRLIHIEMTDSERMGLMSADERVRQETASRIMWRLSREQHADWMPSQGVEEEAVLSELARRERRDARLGK